MLHLALGIFNLMLGTGVAVRLATTAGQPVLWYVSYLAVVASCAIIAATMFDIWYTANAIARVTTEAVFRERTLRAVPKN